MFLSSHSIILVDDYCSANAPFQAGGDAGCFVVCYPEVQFVTQLEVQFVTQFSQVTLFG